MALKIRLKYEKPELLDLGGINQISSGAGPNCKSGSGANEGCQTGTNASMVCAATGHSALGDCLAMGNSVKKAVGAW